MALHLRCRVGLVNPNDVESTYDLEPVPFSQQWAVLQLACLRLSVRGEVQRSSMGVVASFQERVASC